MIIKLFAMNAIKIMKWQIMIAIYSIFKTVKYILLKILMRIIYYNVKSARLDMI